MNGHTKRRGTGKSHIRIRINGKRVLLHRYLFNRFIMPLKDTDIVHHIDDNRFNNNLTNLELCKNRAEHLKKHNYYKTKDCVTQKDNPNEFELGF